MDFAQIATLLTAIGAVIVGFGTLWRILVDRRNGVKGNQIKEEELNVTQATSLFSVQGALLKNVMEVNTDLTQRMDAMEQRQVKQDIINEENRRKINHLETVIYIYRKRETLLVDHIMQGLGPPPPLLPEIPPFVVE